MDDSHDQIDPDLNINLNDEETSNSTTPSVSPDALRPVMLRQVIDAKQPYSGKDVPWYIEGIQIKNVLVVANVIEEIIKPDSRSVTYKISDGTTKYPVTVFRDVGDSSSVERLTSDEVSIVIRPRYVRITGHLTGKTGLLPAIRCYSFHVVEDPNEPRVHILSAMYATMCIQRGPPPREVLQSLPGSVKIPSEDRPAGQDGASAPKRTASGPTFAPSSAKPSTPSPSAPKTEPVTPGPSSKGKDPMPAASPSRRSAEKAAEGEPAAKRPAHDSPQKPGSPSRPAASSSSSRPDQDKPPRQATPAAAREEKRRLSTKDPLSHLDALQRKVLLKIMEGTRRDPVNGLDVYNLAQSLREEENFGDAEALGDALDALMDMDYITTDEEGRMYRAVEQGKRPAYGSQG